jgi:hypothetical protein
MMLSSLLLYLRLRFNRLIDSVMHVVHHFLVDEAHQVLPFQLQQKYEFDETRIFLSDRFIIFLLMITIEWRLQLM